MNYADTHSRHAETRRSCAVVSRRRAAAPLGLVLVFLFLVCIQAIVPGALAYVQRVQSPQQRPLVPSSIQLSAQAARAVDAPFLSKAERADARLFHGVWEAGDLSTPTRRAIAALRSYDFGDQSLSDASVAAEMRAEALFLSGDVEAALELTAALDSPRARRITAQCLEWLGRFDEADRAIDGVIADLTGGRLHEKGEITQAARCLVIRARLRGEPASYFRTVVGVLSQVHQRLDRLYWPAKLVEGELLADKDNTEEAVGALHEVLALNPRCSEAWYRLGEIAVAQYDFSSVEAAAEQLEKIRPGHLLARLLLAEMWITQNRPDEAEQQLGLVLAEMPDHRHALALRAAVEAIRYDEDGMHNALDELDERSPGHPWGYYVVGYQLARNRQYELAASVLGEAIARQPNWPPPQIELGLMELQSGRDAHALQVLERVVKLDPFNMRAAFSLHLLEDLANYETVSSEHFTVRFDPRTSDRVLAAEMLEPLERMHTEISAAFEHETGVPTVIELMPTHARFAVRIAGVPRVHTIAACTGPVIAMESPREGPGQHGSYDWLRVLRHEYVHTITLSSTHNRIPHWFTEAAAVWQELAPRDLDTCNLLARLYRTDGLFSLDDINWGFIRPKRPFDRALAYAQGHWMFEFLIERFGRQKMIDLLNEYAQGFPEHVAMPAALGVSRSRFYDEFMDWAGRQVSAWGLSPQPTLIELLDSLDDENNDDAEGGAEEEAGRRDEALELGGDDDQSLAPRLAAVAEAQWDAWLEQYPGHPDLLRFKIERLRRRQGLSEELVEYLNRYLAARPVDPLAHRLLALVYLESDDPDRAIPHLEELNRRERDISSFAIELARRYRGAKRYQLANARMIRAIGIEPFNPAYRELAAAIALESGDFGLARRHIEALTYIEPGRSQHQRRLERLQELEDAAPGG